MSYKKILIISNNALSTTSNNGKTILSFFEEYPKEFIFQLFTRDEEPTIKIGGYYKVTTTDVIKGRLYRAMRGKALTTYNTAKENVKVITKPLITKNSFTCLIRELLWFKGWKSKQLYNWIKNINPDIIFFVAGDTIYSYSICEYIAKITGADINVYVTDDYITKRKDESVFDLLKRNIVFRRLKSLLSMTKSFFTISEKMRREYKEVLNKDSLPIFNIASDMRIMRHKEKAEKLIFVYTGSLYYGREIELHKISTCLSKLKKEYNQNIFLEIYSGTEVPLEISNYLYLENICSFKGALNKEELIIKLNEADVLVFVESTNQREIEKTRLTLSTKISEYLSVGRPILAVGPKSIGSMEFLSDAAICVHNDNELYEAIFNLITNSFLREKYGKLARKKYEELGDAHSIRKSFIDKLLAE